MTKEFNEHAYVVTLENKAAGKTVMTILSHKDELEYLETLGGLLNRDGIAELSIEFSIEVLESLGDLVEVVKKVKDFCEKEGFTFVVQKSDEFFVFMLMLENQLVIDISEEAKTTYDILAALGVEVIREATQEELVRHARNVSTELSKIRLTVTVLDKLNLTELIAEAEADSAINREKAFEGLWL